MFRLAASSYSNRELSISFSSKIRKMSSFEEVQIPVPWGYISGKWWGNKKAVPLLAIHEFRQNAAAFDKVIPKLNLPSVLAIDLPGHGKSSHFPRGRFVYHTDFLIALRYVSRVLPVGQFTILGHGFGSYIALLYAASYFKQVDNVISVECARHALSLLNLTRSNWMGEISDRFIEIDQTPKEKMKKEQVTDFYRSTSGQMSEEAALALGERGSCTEGDKYFLTIDPRYEMHVLFSFTDEDLMAVTRSVRSNVLSIRNVIEDELPDLSAEEASRNGFYDSNTHMLIRRKGPQRFREVYLKGLTALRNSSRILIEQEVRARNHILLDNADTTATLINTFLATDFETHELFHAN